MSTHDIGLKDLIESASIMGKLPPLHLIVITIPDFQPMELNLSDEIQKVLPDVYQTALEILKKIDH